MNQEKLKASADVEAKVKERFDMVEEVEPDLYIPAIGEEVVGIFKGTRVDDVSGDERESILVESQFGLLRIPAGVNLKRKTDSLKDGDHIVLVRMIDGQSKEGRTPFKNWKVFKVRG